MLTRRAMAVGAAASMAGCAHADGSNLLTAAIEAAGGAAALDAARVLAWTGEATVFAADRRIDLEVETEVEPFHYAKSETWLRTAGRGAMRGLVIEGDAGWLIRDGQRTPMPAAMLRHERAQYALYGLMRLVSLREPGIRVIAERAPEGASGALRVWSPSAPETLLLFDSAARLVAAENIVPSAVANGPPEAQRFDFTDRIEGGGVSWPRFMRITKTGAPYLSLALLTFSPRAVR